LLFTEMECRSAQENAQAAFALAAEIESHPLATPAQKQWGWMRLAAAREQQGNWEGVVDALRTAAEAEPRAPEVWRSIGLVLDLRLSRPGEAVEAYHRFRQLGGADSLITARMAALSAEPR
jgi:hypothetical protein